MPPGLVLAVDIFQIQIQPSLPSPSSSPSYFFCCGSLYGAVVVWVLATYGRARGRQADQQRRLLCHITAFLGLPLQFKTDRPGDGGMSEIYNLYIIYLKYGWFERALTQRVTGRHCFALSGARWGQKNNEGKVWKCRRDDESHQLRNVTSWENVCHGRMPRIFQVFTKSFQQTGALLILWDVAILFLCCGPSHNIFFFFFFIGQPRPIQSNPLFLHKYLKRPTNNSWANHFLAFSVQLYSKNQRWRFITVTIVS